MVKLRNLYLLISVFLASCSGSVGSLTLRNEATEVIARAEIAIGEQKLQFENLISGSSSMARFKIRSDDHFRIHVMFASGRILEKEDGYVTNGADLSFEMVVTNQDVELRNVSVSGVYDKR